MLEELIEGLTVKQRQYIISACLKPKGGVLEIDSVTKQSLINWSKDEKFMQVLNKILGGDYSQEAMQIWVKDRLEDYLETLHKMATEGKDGRTKLDAAKTLIDLLKSEKKKSKRPLMEKYLEG